MAQRPSVRNRGTYQAPGQWLRSSKRRAIYERDGWICGGHLAGNGVYCGRYLGNDPQEQITVDHIVPRQQGGTNHESNLVTCCMSCNSAKAGKAVDVTPPSPLQNGSQIMSDTHSTQRPQMNMNSEVRNRVVEVRNIKASELLDNTGNPRQHPAAQRNVLQGILHEIGIVGTLVAYHSERNGGKLTLIDGHLRKDQYQGEWPVSITDLTDEEADLLLQAYDAVGGMAIYDRAMMNQLMDQQAFQDASVRVMLDDLMSQFKDPNGRSSSNGGDDETAERDETLAEMELKPYEHYDYLLVLARNTFDWNWLCERLGLKRLDGSTDRRVQKPGLGRAIPADVLIKALREVDAQLSQAQSQAAGQAVGQEGGAK